MAELTSGFFPHGGFEVKLVRKEDILKTIDDNIIDKDVARELINNIETKAERILNSSVDAWVSIPYFGSMRRPKTIRLRTDPEFTAAATHVYENKSKDEFVMFMKNSYNDYTAQLHYQAYFNKLAARYARLYPIKYRQYYNEKGEHYARLKIVLSNCFEYSRDSENNIY